MLYQLADGGTVDYRPHFFDPEEADRILHFLKQGIPWAQEVSTFGRPFPRLTQYYSDPGVSYSYSGVTHRSLPWTPVLADIRRRVEEAAQARFNSLLLNYYRDGQDSIGYHSDAEPELGQNPVVPSLSFGGVRTFVLRHNKSREKRTFDLAHGSLLLMGGTLQHHWQHAVPKTARTVGERINLTFRDIRQS